MAGEFHPVPGVVYDVILQSKGIGKGVCIGSQNHKHTILMRLDGKIVRYVFELPPHPEDFDPRYNKYRLEGARLTIPSRATLYKYLQGGEWGLADKILSGKGL